MHTPVLFWPDHFLQVEKEERTSIFHYESGQGGRERKGKEEVGEDSGYNEIYVSTELMLYRFIFDIDKSAWPALSIQELEASEKHGRHHHRQ